jgi:acetyl esterase/lipase
MKPLFLHPWRLGVVAVIALATLGRAAEPQVIPLWEKGAPGFEDRRNEPEQAKDYWVRNIHNPSLTVFPAPKEKANGAAVLIVPGGGHRELVFKAEGVEAAEYLNQLGVTCFVLKHRLPRETNSPYSLQIHPRQDAQRAMRTIRSRAGEWNIDTNRIGAMGFSAGGEVVAMLVYGSNAGDTNAVDAIDRVNCRVDFQIVIYPGGLGTPTERIAEDAPPAFFLVAMDDTSHLRPVLTQLERYREVKRPIEVHLYAKGGHGFNMGQRSKLNSIKTWPQRLADWLADNNLLQPANSPASEKRP